MNANIVLVGRPNVGKSTLFNCLARTRDALVADVPGLTRDRLYGVADLGGRRVALVDTGGFVSQAAGLSAQLVEQVRVAVREATLVLLVVDAVSGLAVEDERLLAWLRLMDRPLFLVVNKVDGQPPAEAAAEFHSLGLAHWQAVSALHARGIARLRVALSERLPEAHAEEPPAHGGPVVAVIGRPNVGKSTLVNCILGEERVLVRDAPGTTRDSVFVPFRRRDRDYTLMDTAGLRRRVRVADGPEKLSALKALESLDRADVALLLLNAKEGIVSQDTYLLNYVLDVGCGLVIAVNQWDGLGVDARRRVLNGMDHALRFLDFVERRCISALTGEGVPGLFGLIDRIHASAKAPLSTARPDPLGARSLRRAAAAVAARAPAPAALRACGRQQAAHGGGARRARRRAAGELPALFESLAAPAPVLGGRALAPGVRRRRQPVRRRARRIARRPGALEVARPALAWMLRDGDAAGSHVRIQRLANEPAPEGGRGGPRRLKSPSQAAATLRCEAARFDESRKALLGPWRLEATVLYWTVFGPPFLAARFWAAEWLIDWACESAGALIRAPVRRAPA